MLKPGDYVRFNFTEKEYAYGVAIWIDGENANIDYKNPVTNEHEVKAIEISKLTKIGIK